VPLFGNPPPDPNGRAGNRDVGRRTRIVLDRYRTDSESHRKTIASRSSVPVFGKSGEPLNKAARKQLEG
jgi:hypothetical protein